MKDNKIIAEFMELETKTFSSGIVNYYHQDIAEGSFFEDTRVILQLVLGLADACG